MSWCLYVCFNCSVFSTDSTFSTSCLWTFMNLFHRELSLRKGDTVYLLQQVDSNWFKGERHGTVGIFPINYVNVSEYMWLILTISSKCWLSVYCNTSIKLFKESWLIGLYLRSVSAAVYRPGQIKIRTQQKVCKILAIVWIITIWFLVHDILRKFDTKNYKFAHLTYILWPHYLEKCKRVIFQQWYLYILQNI